MNSISSSIVAGLAVAVVLGGGPQVAAQEIAGHDHSPAKMAADLAASRRRFSLELEQIKSLAGRWVGTTYREREGTTPTLMTYSITAGGSAVVEVMFPGTSREMTTVYHDDSKGRLVADHYCNAMNQPKLRLAESGGNRLHFVLADDADINAALENHAHELTLAFAEDGSLTHNWLNHYLGAPAQKRDFQLIRLK